ncbi:MAG: DUF924 domain-containing protein [Gemmobacter sp.]|uniref:DUF924 family protein n=1 Tax=Gemmobacter sp. TaxID=1898957 RepID=UPI001A37D74D|nr:DUF924 family protein [Gemmobacter sp.]MBL8561255.1 DUF924 domain-containing protein [Gemmobacter sp.]
MSDPVEVLDFWLGAIGPEGWYAGGPEVDGLCRDGFGDLWQAAHDGGLDHWAEGGPAGSLALIVICDQFARNIWRGDARAFATDPLALRTARKALAEGWDMDAPEPERQFFYMPFEHSEDPEDQALAVQLMVERMPSQPDMALHARAHQAVIARFGRFPFRNAALGRNSTPEEEAFLAEGGYASMVNQLRGAAMQ